MHLLVDEALRHWLDGQAAIQLHNLPFEVLVLELQQLDLTLQIEDDLLLGVHLHDGLVLDVHSASGIIQCRYRFIRIRLRRRHACNHERTGRAAQTIL